ncbi:MAG TPA: DUF4390 domain-containing protein [Vicinamibacterales bacterium]|nr:DUF4390 domain-containing protein [Vicinamibacterales bacterium]
MRLVSAHLRTVAGVCAVMVLAGTDPALAQTAQALRVVPLVRNDQVLVSFELTDGLTDEVKAAIKSGLKTTFTYTVELRMDVPGWVDRTIGTATIASSVEYENLTRQYNMGLRLDGRTENSRVTADENEVKQWMTSLVKLPLFRTSLLEPNREYYVRVSATARPSNGSILWPFGSGTSAQAKFTFIR